MRKSYQRVLTAVILLVATPYSVIAQESRMSAAERLAAYQTPVSYTHLTLPTTPYV